MFIIIEVIVSIFWIENIVFFNVIKKNIKEIYKLSINNKYSYIIIKIIYEFGNLIYNM